MNTGPRAGSPLPRWRKLPAGIWSLGLVSLCMDASSELVHSLLPVFMTAVLGASMVTVGLIEGVAEAIAAFTRVLSGALSDHFRRRKALVVLGYGLALLAKPLFPLATSVAWVSAGRFVDRIGKGIRGAPRDALVADLTAPGERGAAYGLRQALDSIGALLGPLLAVLLMLALANDLKAVLWVAVAPALLAVLVLVTMVHEPARPAIPGAGRPPFTLAGAGHLPQRFWRIVLLGVVFTLARFSEAFLVLRAHDLGVGLAFVPVIMIVMNLTYATAAYPAGAASDRMGPRGLLLAGMFALVVADLALALAVAPWQAYAGAALWGLHMALTQGLLAALVADAAPAALRGTAFGVFNLMTGIAVLLASVIAGLLWSTFGAAGTFLAGAAFALLATAGLLAQPARPRGASR